MVGSSLDSDTGGLGGGRAWPWRLFGVLPRFTSLSWGVLVACLLLGQLGQILQFPQWTLNAVPVQPYPQAARGRSHDRPAGDSHA